MKKINVSLLEKIQNGAKILDIRSAKEYNESHYARAINIPFKNLFAKKDRLGSTDHPIIIYGRSFSKSFEAEKVLKGLGFKNVFVAGTLRNMPELPKSKEEVNG